MEDLEVVEGLEAAVDLEEEAVLAVDLEVVLEVKHKTHTLSLYT